MLQQLREILAAEADARKRLETLRQELEQRVQAADEAARQARREVRDRRETIARGVEDRLVAAAQQQAEEITSAAAAQCAALRRQAEPHLPAAVAAVLRGLLPEELEQ